MKGPRGDRYFTLMLVPEGRKKIYSYVLNTWLLKFIAILSVTLVVALTVSLVTVSHLQKKVARLYYIDELNAMQARQIDKLQEQARVLQERIEEIDELEAQVRAMMGMDQESGQRPGEASRSGRGAREQMYALEEVQTILAEVENETPVHIERLGNLAQELQQHIDYQAALPTGWPVVGSISSPFGWRSSPFGRNREFHDGIDIAASYGSDVQAAGNGRVVYSAYMGAFGWTVIIDHGYGIKSVYSHNSKNLVKTGDEVERGQVISRVGNSGRSTGPHLHFGVNINDQPVDPLKYLEGEYTAYAR